MNERMAKLREARALKRKTVSADTKPATEKPE